MMESFLLRYTEYYGQSLIGRCLQPTGSNLLHGDEIQDV